MHDLPLSGRGDSYLIGPRQAWFAFAMTVALMIFDYVDRQVIVSLFPHLKAEWGLSDTQLGALVSAVSVTVAIAGIPVALFADRVSRVGSIVAMGTVWSLATISCMFTGTYGQLLTARAVVGLGEAGYGSVGAGLLASHFPARMRGALMAGFFASASVGSVLGTMLGAIIAAHWGWKAAFGVVGFPGLVLALLYFFVRDYRTVELTPRLDAATRSARSAALHIVRVLTRSRTMLWMCIGAPAQVIVISAVWSWLPSYLNRVHGLAPQDAGVKAALVVLCGAVGSVVWGWLVDRAGRSRPGGKLRMLALLCLATMLVLGFAFGAPRLGVALSAPAQFALILAGGFLMTCTVGPAAAIVIDVTHPGVRSTGASVLSLFQNLFGLALGPVITGALSDRVGLATAMSIMPAFGLVAIAAMLMASRTYAADIEGAGAEPAEHPPSASPNPRSREPLGNQRHGVPVNGNMMQQPLLISSLLTHAERHHGEREVVSRRVEGDLHRTTYRELAKRSRRMANALAALGIGFGDRVATLAWNGYRHMELYYAVSGSGAVLHTLNPRLHPDQVVWIADHAEDQVLFFDLTFLPLIEAIASRVKTIKAFVAMTDRAHMPAPGRAGNVPNLLCYEELIDGASDSFEWPEFDENSASSLCYTSGTTGNPKGALYSHRSTVLHTYAAALPDSLQCSARDTVLPVVPMFHVNAWGLPYVACMVGAKLVFPGPWLDGKSLHDLFEGEQVTVSAGVPTVWQGLLNHVEANDLKFSTMRRTIIGGSACPPAMMKAFQERYDVHVLHAWGMTEMSPLGTACVLKPRHERLSAEERTAVQAKQGRAVFGVDMKIVGEDGRELPRDGKASGELMVRGPWIISNYFKGEGGDPLVDGWFPTGDVSTIDADGFMQITDRSKDVIKSGGEWIGSIDLENIAVAHPAVAMAACIGARHPKWDERPLLVVVKKPGAQVSKEELLAFYEGKIAKWWTPDDVAFVDAIPLGATGKMQKNKLRDQFADYKLPTA